MLRTEGCETHRQGEIRLASTAQTLNLLDEFNVTKIVLVRREEQQHEHLQGLILVQCNL